MELHDHSLNALFDQLGLPSSSKEIETFIVEHSGQLNGYLPLHKAEFWNASQSLFLKEAKEHDADWAEVVDELDALLRL
ncbi:MAG: DUF2789 family protein [Vibrio sp.]